MKTVIAEYGPPGHKGVTSIMGLGADDLDPTAYRKSNRTVAMVAGGVWVLGLLSGNDALRNLGFGGGLAVLASGMLTSRSEQKASGAAVVISPTMQKGW